MADVFHVDGTIDVVYRPHRGDVFLWRNSSRRISLLRVTSVAPGGEVSFDWEIYLGKVSSLEPSQGSTIWSEPEWRAAILMAYRLPMTDEALDSDEIICPSCNGRYFEILHSSDIVSCCWCAGAGKRKVRKLLQPASQGHPDLA